MNFTDLLYPVIIIVLLTAAAIFAYRYKGISQRLSEMEFALREVLSSDEQIYLRYKKSEETASLSLLVNQVLDAIADAKLQLAEEKVKKKRLLNQFRNNVSEPLNSVIHELHELAQGSKSHPPKATLEQIDRIKNRVDQLSELLLIETDEITLTPKKIDLCQLVRDIVAEVTPTFEQNQFQVETQIPEKKYGIKVDSAAVSRIVHILIANVLTHGKSGRYLGVQVQRSKEEETLSIIVTDHGKGMKKQEVEALFQNLYQPDSETAKLNSQKGISLIIASELARKISGDIGVTSKPEQTAFRLTLPLGE